MQCNVVNPPIGVMTQSWLIELAQVVFATGLILVKLRCIFAVFSDFSPSKDTCTRQYIAMVIIIIIILLLISGDDGDRESWPGPGPVNRGLLHRHQGEMGIRIPIIERLLEPLG